MRFVLATIVIICLASPPAQAQQCTTSGCEGVDVNADCLVDLSDLSVILGNFGRSGVGNESGDTDGDSDVDLTDLSQLLSAFGRDCGPIVDPNEPDNSTANLTAYRPQFRGGYFPQPRLPVSELDEDDPQLGPGIRRTGAADNDPASEDDLIEVVIDIDPSTTAFELVRSNANLTAWTTRDRQPGTELAFTADISDPLPFAGGTTLTIWVEWVAPLHGQSEIGIRPVGRTTSKDTLLFHTFQSLVLALGGEDQQPTVPALATQGTFVVANDLYALGYDVLQYDEDNVSSSGSGSVYNEIVNAIQNRGVTELAIFGYSHGGGSVYHLSDRLDANRGTIGLFEITYTAYADSVRNNSDTDTAQETRRPPSSGLHVNHYQVGSLFEDFFLDGGPVVNSIPAPTGLNVETTPWGANSDHFEIEDFVQVRDLMINELLLSVTR